MFGLRCVVVSLSLVLLICSGGRVPNRRLCVDVVSVRGDGLVVPWFAGLTQYLKMECAV